MATITGFTAARMQDIEDGTVVDGDVVGDNLILTKHDGSTINAGNVRGPQGIQGIQGPQGTPGTALSAWPVGSIFMAVVSTNPATLLGGGTWTRWGQGRMPVSQDGTQTEFDVSEETGGEKTHTLTTAEIPSHNHTQTLGHGGAVSSGTRASDTNSSGSGVVTTSNTGAIDNTGGGGAHNNLPPYIVVYMWKRTA